jgi:hypothetical protein
MTFGDVSRWNILLKVKIFIFFLCVSVLPTIFLTSQHVLNVSYEIIYFREEEKKKIVFSFFGTVGSTRFDPCDDLSQNNSVASISFCYCWLLADLHNLPLVFSLLTFWKQNVKFEQNVNLSFLNAANQKILVLDSNKQETRKQEQIVFQKCYKKEFLIKKVFSCLAFWSIKQS